MRLATVYLGNEEKAGIVTGRGVMPIAAVNAAKGTAWRNPRRIFGIGLNYVDHAGDIGSAAPVGFPGSFFKMADTLIGPGDEICLPALKEAQKTTAKAELGIIMGRDCRDVLSTGTPRAFHIQDSDVAECRIYGPDGFEMAPLVNPVVDLKLHPDKSRS